MGSNLDFESMNSNIFTFSVTVNDGISVSESLNMTILVVDTNEPPQFSSKNYTVFTYEGSVSVYFLFLEIDSNFEH